MADTRETTRPKITRAGDVVLGGRYVGCVQHEPGPPPNWMVIGSSGNAISWHYLRRDAVAEIMQREMAHGR